MEAQATAASRKRRVPLASICNNDVIVVKKHRLVPECCPLLSLLPDWSSIHCDVLENILKYLSLPDILRCRAVCTTWRSSTQSYISYSLNNSCTSLQQKPPLLLWDDIYHEYNWFLDVARPRKNLFQINHKSKQLLRRKMGSCVGFSQGWFLFLGKKKSKERLYLFHPLLFSTTVARFPRIKTPNGESCEDIAQVVVLSDPILTTGGGYGLVVNHESYRHLLFAKCGATRFSELECQRVWNNDPIARWEDMILFGSSLYGIAITEDDYCHMVAWDCAADSSSSTKPRQNVDFGLHFKHPGSGCCHSSYLRFVESQGELLLVCVRLPDRKIIPRILRKQTFGDLHGLYQFVRRPDTCRVYKMDFKEKEWVPMDSLGDRALFIMEFQAVSVSTSKFPQYKRNAVYFHHEINYPGCAPVVGVFNLDDGSMEEIEAQSYY